MGIYLNPGAEAFQEALRSAIYVDKTGLLAYTNRVFKTSDKYLCVTRPRRFGKSIAANMIAAYYDRTAESRSLFAGLKIAGDPSFAGNLGRYDVIKINVQDFLGASKDIDVSLGEMERSILWELLDAYPDVRYFDNTKLVRAMNDIFAATRRPFVIIIDEWDSIFREHKDKKDWQEKYLDFMRAWLKDKTYVGLAYMTGILPIRKCGTHSALNMFDEFTMTNPGQLAEYVGFTAAEVQGLCDKFSRSFTECQTWYDGYYFAEAGEVYSPRSVVAAMLSGRFDSYWNRTETFEALRVYIEMNFDGLKEAIISLMAGERQHLDANTSARDVDEFHDAQDILGMLVYLGYLGYDFDREEVFIPNQEIRKEFATAVEKGKWDIVAGSVRQSDALLKSTLAMDSEAVAKGIEAAHLETSHLQYNDENALSYTLSLAYYTARQKYILVRELPTGKGYADIVFLPRPQHMNLPALILELKWNRGAKAAIAQIKAKDYPAALKDYAGRMLLVGVGYDRGTREHSCVIEGWDKE